MTPQLKRSRAAGRWLSRALSAGALSLALVQAPPPAAAQAAGDHSRLEVLPVQGGVYLVAGAGGNITAQVGADGVVLVDAGLKDRSAEVLAALDKLSDKPIRLILDTNVHPDHTGGNGALAAAGRYIAGGSGGGKGSDGAAVWAREEILTAMSSGDGEAGPVPVENWPTDSYFTDRMEFFMNSEAIQMFHLPAAHSDGDSLVFFRRSDVLSTGDVFNPSGYPRIDLGRGGTIGGILDALNEIIYLAVPALNQERGTMIVPGHGRICDEADVVFYRDMVTILVDRIRNLKDKGMSLEDVVRSRPTRDYDVLFEPPADGWGPDQFVDAVYRTL